MTLRRPLRFFLFVLDVIRLVAVIGALSAFRSSMTGMGGGALGIAAIAFAAPQALFPLMSLFGLLEPLRYHVFSSLYAAGKVISGIAIGACFIGAREDALLALELGNRGIILLAMVTIAVTIYDLASGMAALSLIRGSSHSDKTMDNNNAQPDLVAAEEVPTISDESVAAKNTREDV